MLLIEPVDLSLLYNHLEGGAYDDKTSGDLLISCMFHAARTANRYEVLWYTFDGGGGVSSSPADTVMGSIGQPDAGYHASPVGSENLTVGFWARLTRYLSYSPQIRKP